MTREQKKKVKAWMVRNVEEYRDECNEINATKLAENAALEFNLYAPDWDASIPEWVFDLSAKVAEKFE